MEHPLEYTWNLYVTRNKKKPGKDRSVKEWEDRLVKVCSIASAEEFWGVFNNLKAPSGLHGRGDYLLFKEGVMPEWEDARNEHGGAWNASVNEVAAIDQVWLDVLLHLIGFAFDEWTEHVCGVELTVRNLKYRVSLWTDTCEEAAARALGEALKPLLGSRELEFRQHNSSGVLYRV